MIYTGLNRVGEIADVNAHGGADVAEVYGGINESNPIFYSNKALAGTAPLTFKALGNALKDYHIFGETIQDGTPSPDYPVDVQGCGEKTENLVDESKVTLNTYISASGVIGSSATSNLTDYIAISALPFVISGVRTAGILSPNPRGICFYNSNKNFINGLSYDPDVMLRPTIVSTIPTGAKYVRFTFDKAFENGIMLNLGSTALPYEPYGYKLPLTCGGTEYPIYLGQVPTTRRIKTLVLTGAENWIFETSLSSRTVCKLLIVSSRYDVGYVGYCTHINWKRNYGEQEYNRIVLFNYTGLFMSLTNSILSGRTLADFKSYLATQYANGTPVTVWYVLAEPETGIVNEPLMKIGDYADTISFAQASATLPTITPTPGSNTLSVGTTVQPSSVSITGHIKSSSIYGNLTDVNGTYILDKNDVQIQTIG